VPRIRVGFFFAGEDRKGKLTIERFLEFQRQLQGEILRLEFMRKGPVEREGEGGAKKITEVQFAELLLAYADYAPKRRSAVLKRVKKTYKKAEAKVNPHFNGRMALESLLSRIAPEFLSPTTWPSSTC